MANYCYNYIEFEGSEESINTLVKCFIKLRQDDHSSRTFTEACAVAFPRLIVPEDADYLHFGTKWFEYEIQLPVVLESHTDEDTGEVYSRSRFIVNGDSAWNPPEYLTRGLCEEYGVEATHEYDEPGMDFAGILTVDEKGHCKKEEYSYLEFKHMQDYSYWWDEVIYLLEQKGYKTFEEFAEDHPYADISDLKEAWNIVNKNEDQ